jgi:tetratricopeptide (TPR) repeat protein
MPVPDDINGTIIKKSSGNGSLDFWQIEANQSGFVLNQSLNGHSYTISGSFLKDKENRYAISNINDSFNILSLNSWQIKMNSTEKYELSQTNTSNALISAVENNTSLEVLNATFVDLDKHYTKPLLDAMYSFPFSLLKLILIILAAIIILKVVHILFRDLLNKSSKRQLFIENIVNASADKSLDDVLPGFSEIMREKILANLDRIEETISVRKEKMAINEFGRPPEYLYIPPEADMQPVKELTDSIKDVVPDEVKPILPFLAFIYPKPDGVKISCTLQGHKDLSEILGVTSKISDVRYKRKTEIRTFWENSKKEAICPNTQQILPVEKSDILWDIANSLEQAGLFVDALKYKKEALKINPDKKIESDDRIEELAEHQKKTELSRTYYDIAKKNNFRWSLSEKHLRESLRILNKQDVPPIFPLDWSWITDAERFFKLAEIYNKYKMFDEGLELLQLSKEKGGNLASAKIYEVKSNKAIKLREAGKALQNLCRYSEAKGYIQTALNLSPKDLEAKNLMEKLEADLTKDKKSYERFQGLLEAASLWAAVEITKWASIDSQPALVGRCKACKCLAETYLFTGSMKLAYALTGNNSVLFKAAEHDFIKAKSLCDIWYRPYAYLGDLNFLRAPRGPGGLSFLNRSIIFYEEALKRINKNCDDGNIPYEMEHSAENCNIEIEAKIIESCLKMSLVLSNFLRGIYSSDRFLIIDSKHKLYKLLDYELEINTEKITGIVVQCLKESLNGQKFIKEPVHGFKNFEISLKSKLKEQKLKDLKLDDALINKINDIVIEILKKAFEKQLDDALLDRINEAVISELVVLRLDDISITRMKNDVNTTLKNNFIELDDRFINDVNERISMALTDEIELINLTKRIDAYSANSMSAKALYNFACLMGLIFTYFERGGNILIPDKKICKIYARKLLIKSFIQDRYGDVGPLAKGDPDLNEVISTEMITHILFNIDYTKVTSPEKLEEVAKNLTDEIIKM